MNTRTYRTNLNCGSCVAAVRPILDGEQAIRRWEVDTSTPEKRLTVTGEGVGPEQVRELVARAGFKVLDEIAAPDAPTSPATEAAPGDGPPASYYPLALVLAFLVGLVALAEWRAGTFDWMRAMNHFMGGFFVAFAFFKLLDVPAFADSFAGYDILAARSRAYALAYPLVELALGVAYLAGVWPLATNAVTLVLMVVGTGGVVQALMARRKIRCACLGAVFNLPMSTVTLLEDVAMAGMAAVMLLVLMLG